MSLEQTLRVTYRQVWDLSPHQAQVFLEAHDPKEGLNVVTKAALEFIIDPKSLSEAHQLYFVRDLDLLDRTFIKSLSAHNLETHIKPYHFSDKSHCSNFY